MSAAADISAAISGLVNAGQKRVFEVYNQLSGLDTEGLVHVRPDGTLPPGVLASQVIVDEKGCLRYVQLSFAVRVTTRMATLEDLERWRDTKARLEAAQREDARLAAAPEAKSSPVKVRAPVFKAGVSNHKPRDMLIEKKPRNWTN